MQKRVALFREKAGGGRCPRVTMKKTEQGIRNSRNRKKEHCPKLVHSPGRIGKKIFFRIRKGSDRGAAAGGTNVTVLKEDGLVRSPQKGRAMGKIDLTKSRGGYSKKKD